jgi:hypothetical protein
LFITSLSEYRYSNIRAYLKAHAAAYATVLLGKFGRIITGSAESVRYLYTLLWAGFCAKLAALAARFVYFYFGHNKILLLTSNTSIT